MEIDFNKISNQYHLLTQLLIDHHFSISTMESCTTGLVGCLIADLEGSSAVYIGSMVTYSNICKEYCGVSEIIISKYGVYSSQTSQEMAQKCQQFYHSDISIGVTGTLGNIDPNNYDSKIGEVYYHICFKDKNYSYFLKLDGQSSRFDYKLEVCKDIVEHLLMIIQQEV